MNKVQRKFVANELREYRKIFSGHGVKFKNTATRAAVQAAIKGQRFPK